jgi:hypothetical protein
MRMKQTPPRTPETIYRFLFTSSTSPEKRYMYNILFNSYLWTYDLYGHVRNAFDAGNFIPRASGRGLGPGKGDFFGPCEMASSHQASAIWGPKKLRFPGPHPLPLAQVWICPHQKHYVQGSINQMSICSFMYMSFFVLCSLFCVLCSVFCVLCSVFCVLCSVFFVLCSVFRIAMAKLR